MQQLGKLNGAEGFFVRRQRNCRADTCKEVPAAAVGGLQLCRSGRGWGEGRRPFSFAHTSFKGLEKNIFQVKLQNTI